MIDLDALEACVERCRRQTLKWQDGNFSYKLSKSIHEPAWWSASIRSFGLHWEPTINERGLQTILDTIKTEFPEFSVYLATTFPLKKAKENDVH